MRRLALLFVTLLTCSQAFAEARQNFFCVSGDSSATETIHVTLSGCLDANKTKLVACKGQNESYLGTPYLTLSKTYFLSGREIAPPVTETVLIPAQYVTISTQGESGRERIVLQAKSDRFGQIHVEAPLVNGPIGTNPIPRRFVAETRAIQHKSGAVVCNFLK
jgi:hypothetical protein